MNKEKLREMLISELKRHSAPESVSDDAIVEKDVVTSEVSIADYDQFVQLWHKSGINYRDVNTREKLERFLMRNPGLSSVCKIGDRVVGVLLCGEDGLRACIYHVAVDREFRRLGIGTLMVERSLGLLASTGIEKCKLFVSNTNFNGEAFWQTLGWVRREDAFSMTFSLNTECINEEESNSKE